MRRSFSFILCIVAPTCACQVIAGIDELEEYRPKVGDAGAGQVAGFASVGGAQAGSGAGGGLGLGGSSSAGAPQVAGAGGAFDCTPNATPTRCTSEGIPEYCAENGTWQTAAPCTASTPLCRDGACIPPPSCDGLSATCGSGENCCETLEVQGGIFDREHPQGSPAEVSAFWLDKYEITVGRFRKFLESGAGVETKSPSAGSGKHPVVGAQSGWNSSWQSLLEKDKELLVPLDGSKRGLNCEDYPTWYQDDENRPINCITWYEAFAFCVWDGGRLPTEAEWAYAAAGGSEQRVYPWGDERPVADSKHAAWNCYFAPSPSVCSAQDIAPVGSAVDGAGKFGQLDLAGNVAEWVFDYFAANYKVPCEDCAELTVSAERVTRGGDFSFADGKPEVLSNYRRPATDPLSRRQSIGARCARDFPAR